MPATLDESYIISEEMPTQLENRRNYQRYGKHINGIMRVCQQNRCGKKGCNREHRPPYRRKTPENKREHEGKRNVSRKEKIIAVIGQIVKKSLRRLHELIGARSKRRQNDEKRPDEI